MTQVYASVAIGTTAFVLTVLLLLMRAEVPGRARMVALTRWWVAADIRTASLVLALLSGIAGCAFALIPQDERSSSGAASLPAVQANADTQHTPFATRDADPEIAALQAYAERVAAEAAGQSPSGKGTSADPAELPDVETMIAKLVARLERQPDDVEGWKMLGWSYLNTDRLADAARAYETALKLRPGDAATMKALEAVASAKGGAKPMQAAGPSDPARKDERPASDQDGGMIRGMVDRLDERLAMSPEDQDGWLQLIRSRMVLGEEDAARAALAKAIQTFSGDAAARTRLAALARELGLEVE